MAAVLRRTAGRPVGRCPGPYGEVERELEPEAAALLARCDGARTARQVLIGHGSLPVASAHRMLDLWYRFGLVDFAEAR